MKPSFVLAADALGAWRDHVLSGKPPARWPLGMGALERIECGPGAVLLIGGPPGAGKTALGMQLLVDALRLTGDLRALVANVEMHPDALLDRQLARLSGIDLTAIRRRRLGVEHADRIDQALNTLEPLAERLAILRQPFSLENVAAAADAFEARLLVLDYIQRIPPPGEYGDKRGSVNATMEHLRRFADAGIAIIVVSAIGRTRDNKGRSCYAGEGLNLASFRESSELEFGCDDAYILTAADPGEDVTLRHLKSRHGECRDIDLRFCRRLQRFTCRDNGSAPPQDAGKARSALAAAWARTRPASEGADGEDA